jgi:hypothetical protein
VFKFLLAQKDLQLSDLTKVNLTVADVKISYVHGIWYEVSSRGQASSRRGSIRSTNLTAQQLQRQRQMNKVTAQKQQMPCWRPAVSPLTPALKATRLYYISMQWLFVSQPQGPCSSQASRHPSGSS